MFKSLFSEQGDTIKVIHICVIFHSAKILPSPSSCCLPAQANISGDHLLGQRIETLFWKPADWEDWFPPGWGGDVLISSFLHPFTGGSGQDVSCELKKGILA